MKRYSCCNKPMQFFMVLLAIFLPAFAYAHPGMHHPHNWLDGAIHLLTETDHLAVIIAAVALIFYIRNIRRKRK